MKIKTLMKVGVVALAATIAISSSAFADIDCKSSAVVSNNGDAQSADAKYPELSTAQGKYYTYKCVDFTYKGTSGGVTNVQYYGHDRGACATAGMIAADPMSMCNTDESNDITKIVQAILNTVIFIIGILAVVMVVLGGISYATSQGDPQKVKKGKDTILYGIVGLVISVFAYAIVQFVVNAIQN